jgi:hypothetical protein
MDKEITRENINKYYKTINELISKYFTEWEISPTALRSHFKKGSENFNRFLEINSLNQIKGTDLILDDILNDHYHMEKDSEKMVKENVEQHTEFSLLSSVKPSDISYEKSLADALHTSMGHIISVDTKTHKYKDDENKNHEYYIFNNKDLGIIKDNLIIHYRNILIAEESYIKEGLYISLKDIIDYPKFNIYMSNYYKTSSDIQIIKDFLKEEYAVILDVEIMKYKDYIIVKKSI